MENEFPTVVIDNGSFQIKAGFSPNKIPSAVFPTIVGRLKEKGTTMKDSCVGEEAIALRSKLELKSPVKNGNVKNWDDMEKIWHHTFYDRLKVAPEETKTFCTEKILTPSSNRERMTQIMFETFNVSKFFVASQSSLALYSNGKTTGVVIDSGENVTHSIPIYDGYPLPHAVKRIEMGGRNLTENLMKLLSKSELDFSDLKTRELVRRIKERNCYVALDFEKEKEKQKSSVEKRIELPDGKIIKIDQQRFECIEALFRPELMGFFSSGLSQRLYHSILSLDIDIRASLFENIYLSGGNTLLDGFKERLEKDLSSIQSKYKVKVNAPPERRYSSWIGASIISSFSSFQHYFISKEEYDDSGPSLVHRKCYF